MVESGPMSSTKAIPLMPLAAPSVAQTLHCARWPRFSALAAGCDAGTVAIEPDPLPPPDQWEANPRPGTVAVGPLTATLSSVGDTLRLTARVTDQYGQALTVPVAWSVDQPGVAAVDSAGLVTARRNGTAVVTATAGGVSGSATVTVVQAVAAAAPASRSLRTS